MSRIAQKLCAEIVEPALKSTRDSTTKSSSNKYLNQCHSNQDNITTRSIIIEKKKVINKLVPNDLSASSTKFRSKETLLKKKFTDISVNTLVTGPLRCDTDCVTMVRKRDNKLDCKCIQKCKNCKASAKQIQTFCNRNLSLTDKACAHCIETNTCGTQFLEINHQSNSGTMKSLKDNMKIHSNIMKDSSRSRYEDPPSRPAFTNFMGARRWALSQYPTRGPDF